ncbi:PTS glucose transporter subunit IIA [Celerinatantimonas diazotrophica]|uniref:PTS system beta-glucosides-specific IIC component n=1 Tax=Celerinatantimonas diazotrophica TaxID=412034 RepID=A0A4R1J7D0_9GAMM|nr:PTS glucose transporter subunit IIA [Celerinatantimonas diazotrophica]TCK46355.1 PTS system beta-glucosides-specific IIC component [Celerinatantimonas diazotrophica]CAG9295271.1 PTS system beta-glucoside-specific EIIBCA component [Celerinatantimonas diazotrophica]
MDRQLLTQLILELIGGGRNLLTLELTHATLVVQLKKPDQVQTDSLTAINDILSMTLQDQQLRLGLGPNCRQVYQQLLTQTGLTESTDGFAQVVKKNGLSQLIDILTDLFQPLIYVLIGAGITKGVIDVLLALTIIPPASITAIILQTVSNSLFYFLPIFIAATAAKRFQTDQFIVMTIAASLVYPGVMQFMQSVSSPQFKGAAIIMANSSRYIWPIVVCVYVSSLLGRWLNKHFHESCRTLLTPFTLLAVMMPATLIITGPLLNTVRQLVMHGVDITQTIAPMLPLGILASSWHLLQILGIGSPLANEGLTFAQLPRSQLALILILATYSQSGAILGVWIKTHDLHLKRLCAGSLLASLLGVSLPGIFAVTLRYKTPFLCAMVSAGIGALAIGLLSLILRVPPATLPESVSYWPIAISATVLTAMCSTVLSYWCYQEHRPHHKQRHKADLETIYAPFNGHLRPLEQLDDGLFSIGVMGQGIAITPINTQLRAPVDGTVTQIDSHTLTLTSHTGIELLIQTGLNNHRLDEPGLMAHCQRGDQITRGQLLAELTHPSHGDEKLNLDVPIVITNSENYHVTFPEHQITDATFNQVIMTVN